MLLLVFSKRVLKSKNKFNFASGTFCIFYISMKFFSVFRRKMSTSTQRHSGRKEPGVLTQSMGITVTFHSFLSLSSWICQSYICRFYFTPILLLLHPIHLRAAREPMIHRATFASRLHSDFKHPDTHTSALRAIPPELI